MVFLLLLLITSNPLCSKGKIVYAFDISNSYYAAIPHFDDEIPFRSSNTTSLALGLFGYEAETFSLGLDLHALFVTPSIPFGNYQGRGFNAIGFKARATYQINHNFAIFSSISSEANYYRSIKEAFISYSLQLGPQFRVFETTMHAMDITIPLTIHLRKEITAPMLGVGLRYSLSPHKKQEKP